MMMSECLYVSLSFLARKRSVAQVCLLQLAKALMLSALKPQPAIMLYVILIRNMIVTFVIDGRLCE